MRVVTFNVQHGWRDGQPDVVALADGLAALDPDLIALQEIDQGGRGVDQPGAVAAAIGGRSVFEPLHPQGDTGLALVARGRIDDVGVTRFVSRRSHARDWHGRVPLLHPDRRACLWARVTIDGRSLTVGTAHLHLVRTVSHLQLERAMGVGVARPGPKVFMGDLNRRPDWVRPTLAAVGFDLVDDDTPTHPAERPVRRIDHVAVSGVAVRATEVVRLGVSDHRAIVTDLDL